MDDLLDPTLYRWLSEAGLLLNDPDVEAEACELPPSLSDPDALVSVIFADRPRHATVYRLDRDREIDAGLARAAREGGDIAPEVEALMRRDRDQAESDAEGE